MDSPINVGAVAEEARNADTAGEISRISLTKAPKVLNWPEDVLRIIFGEFMSKPSVHFAETRFYEITRSKYSMSLRPYSKNDIQSGYTAAQVLSQTSHLGCDVVRRSTLLKSHIRMDSGPVPVDAATDLVCFVLPGPWYPHLVYTNKNGSFSWCPRLDHKDIAEKLGNLRRAGVLMTK
jgi:hypothetical protein